MRRFGAGFSLRRKHKQKHNGSEDAQNTSRSTWAWAEWIITLFLVEYLLDTVEKTAEITVMLML